MALGTRFTGCCCRLERWRGREVRIRVNVWTVRWNKMTCLPALERWLL